MDCGDACAQILPSENDDLYDAHPCFFSPPDIVIEAARVMA